MLKVELHCHTYHSVDSIMRPEKILAVCARRGIDRIAITDHNSIAGARETAALAPERVIIGEEILTTEGELLAFFVQEEVPRGLPPAEVVARLRAQGAVISVSHPFDPMRGSPWKPGTLEALAPELDAVEVFNARCWTAEPNEQAAAFARRFGLSGTAGSDAHAPVEVGRAYLAMPDFTDAQSFRTALPQAQVMGRRSQPWVHMTSAWARWRKATGWTPDS